MSREQVLLRVRPWCHWLILTMPLLMLHSAGLMNYVPNVLAASLPLLIIFGVLPLSDYLVGREGLNWPVGRSTFFTRRLLPLLCVPAQFLLLWWGLQKAVTLSLPAAVVWLLSMGVIGGVLAINVAHELIHRRSRVDRTAGGLLLAMVNYAGFKVEHLRSHHIYVATPKDTSTARLNQSVYHFIAVSLVKNPYHAWLLESRRLQRQGLPAWHWRNELLWWYGVSVSMALLMGWMLGTVGVLAYMFQGVVAAATLEVINYIEHYGLQRQKLPDGRLEPPDARHSWNSDYFLSNAILLQLQRHADHHANPLRQFPYLRHLPAAPQLPLGYAAMFTLALIPPLWRAVMNPRVAALKTVDKPA